MHDSNCAKAFGHGSECKNSVGIDWLIVGIFGALIIIKDSLRVISDFYLNSSKFSLIYDGVNL